VSVRYDLDGIAPIGEFEETSGSGIANRVDDILQD
jgi:hypothetical protein